MQPPIRDVPVTPGADIIIRQVFPWCRITELGRLFDVSEHRQFRLQHAGMTTLSYVKRQDALGPERTILNEMFDPDDTNGMIGFVSLARGEWNEATYRTSPMGKLVTDRHNHTYIQLADTNPPYDTPSLFQPTWLNNYTHYLRHYLYTPISPPPTRGALSPNPARWEWLWCKDGAKNLAIPIAGHSFTCFDDAVDWGLSRFKARR